MSSTMVIAQPQPQPVLQLQRSDEWGSGICDFCQDKPDCCFAFWCFPCFTCITTRKYGQPLCLPLLDFLFGAMIPPITMTMRVSMRQRYGIRGTMCKDCLYSYFCAACSWCQMAREMKRREIRVILMNAKIA